MACVLDICRKPLSANTFLRYPVWAPSTILQWLYRSFLYWSFSDQWMEITNANNQCSLYIYRGFIFVPLSVLLCSSSHEIHQSIDQCSWGYSLKKRILCPSSLSFRICFHPYRIQVHCLVRRMLVSSAHRLRLSPCRTLGSRIGRWAVAFVRIYPRWNKPLKIHTKLLSSISQRRRKTSYHILLAFIFGHNFLYILYERNPKHSSCLDKKCLSDMSWFLKYWCCFLY